MNHYAARGAVIDRLLTEQPGVRILRVVVDEWNGDHIEILTEQRLEGVTYEPGSAIGHYRTTFDMDGIAIDAFHVELDEIEVSA